MSFKAPLNQSGMQRDFSLQPNYNPHSLIFFTITPSAVIKPGDFLSLRQMSHIFYVFAIATTDWEGGGGCRMRRKGRQVFDRPVAVLWLML